MSRDSWNIDYGPLRGFYRDRENGWVFGVCAGIADRFNFRVGTVRVLAIISLLLFLWDGNLCTHEKAILLCSFCGLNITMSVSSSALTLCPGGQ